MNNLKMKYDDKKFYEEVKKYTDILKDKVKDKIVFVLMELDNEKAFFSIAPLSRAIHNIGGDLHVLINGNNNFEILKDVWYVYEEYKKGLDTDKVNALKGFIQAVNKRTKKETFENIFKKPEFILKAEEKGFSGTLELDYYDEWHKKYRFNELVESANQIWGQGYALKKGEKVGVSFVLVPDKENTELPLEDYLDSYFIALAMAESAIKKGAHVSLSAFSDRFSMLAKSVRSVDLATTLKGCELDKDIDEDVFKKYNIFSKEVIRDRMKYIKAGFSIHGKGYYGKHFFGEEIGYPTSNKKSRWTSPGQMMLKDRYSPQSLEESRDPVMRYALTETLPIDIFIETCNLDYTILKKRSDKIRDIFNKCSYIRVVGEPVDGHKTDFKVELIRKDGFRRAFTSSDCDVTNIIDQENLKKTGARTGSYANFPSGETFTTPEKVTGVMVGDVVINIDRSYVIPPNNPIVVSFDDNGDYKIVKAPADIKKAMDRELKECREKIKIYEKNGSLPKEITDMYTRNFNSVGEFAVNTNPKAKLCDYLIVNEKIAKMIHVALGLGFDPDKKTVYHWDIVVNSPRQKLDIYGVDADGKTQWVIKKGEFVV